ncbi:DUF4276 family protein [Enhygromyxa salina]|uniref:DUF4276 domain-containing protein n=1 Tax=Enhygromyxa salina TaxID=215803 RepID=A0A2S9YCA5_9BACT|nr:DUF4276 family protein [Enhygromyxa salina]PRQ02723.1 hypothetical protein ENSA7_55520 [Enhygromyxa salina]
MIYLRAGLYAEGPTDYYFLCPLLNRMLREIAAQLFPGANEIEDTRGIDSSGGEKTRADRIAAAVRDNEDLIDILIIHADGAGNPAAVIREQVAPGIEAARTAIPNKPIPAIPCVPVREIEAWLLADESVFREQLGVEVALPAAPERELDPKRILRERLPSPRGSAPGIPYTLFGEQVSLAALRRLAAFTEFEAALTQLVRSFGPGRS